ncbi:hypothetical protein [Nocardioides yefusunii]|uniref:Helix-turn-helix domain-containing protein n=1 Tax=Nocardioides yefusunii TaxID=2500546 RepID=A0ABW1QZE8_9ACTN|nr:hypothetical protein [Nocardioides yefusunii]
MGARNVSAVFTFWSKRLDSAPFRVLTYMALITHDDDSKQPRFWGGWEVLASVALGRDLTLGSEEAHRRAVSRAIEALRKAGALTNAQESATGRRAEYFLHFTGTHDAHRPVGKAVPTTDATQQHTTLSDRDTRRSLTERTTLSGEAYDADRRPKEVQEPQGTTSGINTHSPTATHRHARVTVAEMNGMEKVRAALADAQGMEAAS